MGRRVAVGLGVAVGVGVTVGRGVAVGDKVAVALGVPVGRGVAVGDKVAVALGVPVGDKVAVGIRVGDSVGGIALSVGSWVATMGGIGVSVGKAATVARTLASTIATISGVWLGMLVGAPGGEAAEQPSPISPMMVSIANVKRNLEPPCSLGCVALAEATNKALRMQQGGTKTSPCITEGYAGSQTRDYRGRVTSAGRV